MLPLATATAHERLCAALRARVRDLQERVRSMQAEKREPWLRTIRVHCQRMGLAPELSEVLVAACAGLSATLGHGPLLDLIASAGKFEQEHMSEPDQLLQTLRDCGAMVESLRARVHSVELKEGVPGNDKAER
jgi:hypothetical protein